MIQLQRLETQGAAGSGAMLYNPLASGKLVVPWFEPRWWIARDAVVGQAIGRGTTHIVRDEERLLVLRHYRRGGFVARISPDHYVWRGEAATRPFRELSLLAQLHAAGLPVPVPVGARYLRKGRLYTGDLLTEYLPGTRSLAQRLVDGSTGLATWAAIGRCLRRFHEEGVFHADLNAHNILLRDDAVFVIDFDRGRLRRPGLWCDANLVRLRRSLEKIDAPLPKPQFDDAQWHCLLAAYASP
jgi:3-deoxy-D-manno-octulosonic acid kinase